MDLFGNVSQNQGVIMSHCFTTMYGLSKFVGETAHVGIADQGGVYLMWYDHDAEELNIEFADTLGM